MQEQLRRSAGWAFLFFLGVLCIILGFEGRVGSFAGALFTPSSLVDGPIEAEYGGSTHSTAAPANQAPSITIA